MKPATEIQTALSEKLDEALLDILTNGRKVYAEDGATVIAVNMPSAADFNAIISRLKQCGVATIPTEGNADINEVLAIRIAFAFNTDTTGTFKVRFGNVATGVGRTSRMWAGSVLKWKRLN